MDDKRKTFDVKNFIKKETTFTGTRLTSLGVPRDLNLVGNKPKKLYTPNLNVVRNKDKKKEIIRNKIEEAKKLKQLKTRPKPERQQPQIVHAGGVFSEGFHGTFRSPVNSSRNYHSYEGESSSTIKVPKYEKDAIKIDHSSEASVVDDLLNNCSDSDDDDDDDGQGMTPVCLFNLKKETESNSTSILPTYSTSQQYISDNYDDENPYITTLKMPESLAGKYFAENSDDKNIDYRLCDMHEGQIGKLVIRQSGKMELVVGNSKYNMYKDDDNPYYEEIIYTPDNATKPNLIKLGPVDDRFMVVPKWEDILK